MKKIILSIMFCGLMGLNSSAVLAGAGHSHGPISKEKAIIKAEKRLGRLVKKGKVDKSWKGIKANRAEKKTYNGKEEWLVTFKNPGLSDKSKQTLYMFFKIDGHYLATNYTGK
ncbi:MAG: DUF6488 family protein [Gammaproteobacteria bacterium]|nr:DUF6488 family protein [Gammaproteobacteria bacterium]